MCFSLLAVFNYLMLLFWLTNCVTAAFSNLIFAISLLYSLALFSI